MMNITEVLKELNKFRSDNDSLVESANNATLKQVMLKAAELLASKYLSKNISYDIHHLDYDNKNNNLENISLMPSKLHNSFHGKAHHLSTKAKKDLLFNNGGYADKCIKIGELIKNLAITSGEQIEN